MIIETLFLPHLALEVPQHDEDQGLYFNWCIQVLQAILENGLMLCDDRDVLLNAIDHAIDGWPQKYRKLAKVCRERLGARHRLIQIPIPNPNQLNKTRSCDWANAVIANCSIAPRVLGPRQCFCGLRERCPMNGRHSASIYQTALLDFLADQRLSMSFLHQRNQYSKLQFQEKVLEPILRHAKRITIIDKFIGLGALTTDPVAMKPDFCAGIEWILELFVQLSPKPRLFEIITETDAGGNSAQIARQTELLEYFAKFIESSKQQYSASGVDIKIHVKQCPRGNPAFDHDRYLLTDQFGFLFTRGFDLLDSVRGVIKDGAVFQLPFEYSNVVDSAVRRLPSAQ